MIRAAVILGVAAALIAGCGAREDRIAFDGQFFRSSISRVDGDRQQFAVSVSPATASLEGALEAGRYEVTSYCVKHFGTSSANWVVGPDQDPGTYRIENDTLVLRGSCEWR